jgi:membrane fusion protein (multidrug efflux system)
VAVLGALPLLAACAPDPAPPVAEAPLPVTLHQVGPAGAAAPVRAAGTVRLRRETPLAFLSDGRVRSITVREGDRVGQGQVLAALDRTALDSRVIAADSSARQAAAELERQRQLFREGWVSKARVEAAEAAARGADAERTGARFSQRFATISAPAAGVVLARLAEPGQTLSAGTPVLVLGEYGSGFVVRVPLAAGAASRLARGMAARIDFADAAAPAMAGSIVEIAGRADPGTGTFQVEVALPSHPALRSGLIAEVAFPAAPRPGAAAPALVPASAVFAARAEEGFVWRYEGGRVKARQVSLGAVGDAGVEVLAGLDPGDMIVRAGVDRLVDGQRVSPVRAAQRAARQGAAPPAG